MPKPEWKPVYGKNVYSTPAQVRQKAAQTAAAAPLATPLAAARHEVAQLDKRLTTHPVLVDRQDWQAPHTMPPVASHQERAAMQVNLWSGAKENRSVSYANLGEPKAIAAPGYMMDQTRAHYEALNELHALGHANPLASGIPPAHFEAAWGSARRPLRRLRRRRWCRSPATGGTPTPIRPAHYPGQARDSGVSSRCGDDATRVERIQPKNGCSGPESPHLELRSGALGNDKRDGE